MLINDNTLTEQEKQAVRDHHLKGDLKEDVIKAVLENNPGSDTVMALLQAEDTKDYALALLTSLPTERALAVLGKLNNVIEKGRLISSANKPINGQGLSAAARAWAKHAGRQGGTFEPLKGNVVQQNAAAEKFVNEVLNNPQTVRHKLSGGGFEYRLPNG